MNNENINYSGLQSLDAFYKARNKQRDTTKLFDNVNALQSFSDPSQRVDYLAGVYEQNKTPNKRGKFGQTKVFDNKNFKQGFYSDQDTTSILTGSDAYDPDHYTSVNEIYNQNAVDPYEMYGQPQFKQSGGNVNSLLNKMKQSAMRKGYMKKGGETPLVTGSEFYENKLDKFVSGVRNTAANNFAYQPDQRPPQARYGKQVMQDAGSVQNTAKEEYIKRALQGQRFQNLDSVEKNQAIAYLSEAYDNAARENQRLTNNGFNGEIRANDLRREAMLNYTPVPEEYPSERSDQNRDFDHPLSNAPRFNQEELNYLNENQQFSTNPDWDVEQPRDPVGFNPYNEWTPNYTDGLGDHVNNLETRINQERSDNAWTPERRQEARMQRQQQERGQSYAPPGLADHIENVVSRPGSYAPPGLAEHAQRVAEANQSQPSTNSYAPPGLAEHVENIAQRNSGNSSTTGSTTGSTAGNTNTGTPSAPGAGNTTPATPATPSTYTEDELNTRIQEALTQASEKAKNTSMQTGDTQETSGYSPGMTRSHFDMRRAFLPGNRIKSADFWYGDPSSGGYVGGESSPADPNGGYPQNPSSNNGGGDDKNIIDRLQEVKRPGYFRRQDRQENRQDNRARRKEDRYAKRLDKFSENYGDGSDERIYERMVEDTPAGYAHPDREKAWAAALRNNPGLTRGEHEDKSRENDFELIDRGEDYQVRVKQRGGDINDRQFYPGPGYTPPQMPMYSPPPRPQVEAPQSIRIPVPKSQWNSNNSAVLNQYEEAVRDVLQKTIKRADETRKGNNQQFGGTPNPYLSMYEEGGEYYLSEEDIEQILAMGGEIEFLD
jgi:hypothetical protein